MITVLPGGLPSFGAARIVETPVAIGNYVLNFCRPRRTFHDYISRRGGSAAGRRWIESGGNFPTSELEHLEKEENQAMSLSIYQIVAAVLMVGGACVLFVAIRIYMVATSERRMNSMLERVGVDPVIVASGNAKQIIKDIRRRCHHCASEALCERWLAGEEQGGNEFCPNANVFATLRKT